MSNIKILGLLIKDRIKEAGRTQAILSKHARIIKTRLGFHELSETKCSRTGIIILQLTGNPDEWHQLESDLAEIGGLEIREMSWDY